MGDNRLVIRIEPKIFIFIYRKILALIWHYSIMKQNELLAEHTIKSEFKQLLSI